MSQPPLNEDRVHIYRTPNNNVAAGLGLMNPAGSPIKYSGNQGDTDVDPPLPIPLGVSLYG